jgi:hypothetical protein
MLNGCFSSTPEKVLLRELLEQWHFSAYVTELNIGKQKYRWPKP